MQETILHAASSKEFLVPCFSNGNFLAQAWDGQICGNVWTSTNRYALDSIQVIEKKTFKYSQGIGTPTPRDRQKVAGRSAIISNSLDYFLIL
jgi:hypothetical protein